MPSVPSVLQFGGVIEDIKVGNFVVIGSHSCVLPGVDIPEGAAFGAYTLVKKENRLSPFHLYVGQKCRELGQRENIESIEKIKLEMGYAA